MSVADKLIKLDTDINASYDAVGVQGGIVPEIKNTENLAPAIMSIPKSGGGTTTYTVTFNSDGGSEVASQEIVSGYTAKEPDAPTRDGYKLNYWTLNGVEYDFDTPVTSDITLVAVWEEDVEYTKLEYIESSGTQYIDTGFKPNQNTIVEFEISSNESNKGYFGCNGTIRDDNENVGLVLYEENAKYKYKYSYTGQLTTIRHGSKDVILMNKNKLIINDNEAVTINNPGTVDFESIYNAYIFGWNQAGTLRNPCSMKLYYCKIYDNNTLIRDFIPVLNAENVACLYDKVSKTYFYNQGTGSFTAGSVIL